MNILENYPTMTPYVGKRFHSADALAMLLIGESHYLPKESTQHETPESWYARNASTLSETEIHWISTSRIVTESRLEGFRNKSHWIWKNPLHVINERGPGYDDPLDACDHVAFCNFFLRPAYEGKSLDVGKEDVRWANARLMEVIEELKPDVIVFLSRLARCHCRTSSDFAIPTETTPHPTSAWWNRKAKKHGNRSGREILGDFVSRHWPG